MPTKAKHAGPRLGRLRKIAKYVKEEPLRLDMGNWCVTGQAAKEEYGKRTPHCKTVGCIAGWAVQLYGGKRLLKKAAARSSDGSIDNFNTGINFSYEAQRLLGLSSPEAGSLFLPGYWPDEFKERLDEEKQGTPEYAEVVADRIKDFAKKTRERRKRNARKRVNS